MKDQKMLAGSGEIAEDNGTLGLTVYGNVGADMQTVLSYTAMGQVQSSVAWLTGGFTGTEGPQGPEPAGIEIAQLWDDNGALGLNIYGDVGGTLQPVFTSGDMGQGSGALAWLTGNFTGTGNDFTEIAQLWNNDGALGLIIYGSPGGNPQAVFAQPDMGQGSGAVAFLAGNFTGSATTEIAQLWDNNGVLGLIVYSVANGILATPVAQPDMGQGSSALAFLAGTFTGSATTEIAQLWNNNGALGLIVYGMSGGTLQTLVTYPDMGQGSSALAFLVGDFTGSGATEIAQLWDNNGILGLIVYSVANGILATPVAQPDMGQGSGALAFLTGYFTGAGTTTQIAQPWDNNGTLEMIVYGNVGDGNLGTVYAAPMNQPSSALAFLTGNFIGSGYTQIAQARNNNEALQLLVYADIGNGGLSTVFSNDISQVPFALAWVTGDFTGTGNTQILQPSLAVFG